MGYTLFDPLVKKEEAKIFKEIKKLDPKKDKFKLKKLKDELDGKRKKHKEKKLKDTPHLGGKPKKDKPHLGNKLKKKIIGRVKDVSRKS